MQSKQHSREKAALRRGLRRNKSGRYPLEGSPLWKLSSLHRLAELLRVSPDELEEIAKAPSYDRFIDKPGTKKERHVQEPLGLTMSVHYRLVKLLDSIKRPEFLHSATKKRSYISNAEAHRAGHAIVQTDIRKFYENTTYQHVKAFLHKGLGWSHDLARLVARACTADGHLPTGSCISPLLSYFVHRQMFAGIEELCRDRAVTLTLYVDDLTLSGPHATKALLYEVKSRIRRCDLETHKETYVSPGNAGLVTGVALHGGQVHLRNKQHEAIVQIIDSIAAGDSSLVDNLNGKLAAAQAVEPVAAAKLVQRYKKRSALAGQRSIAVMPNSN